MPQALMLALLGLTACGGGGNSNADRFGSCRTISGGDTSVSFNSGCATCRVSNQNAAIDGNKDSAASITLDTGSAGSVALQAHAQRGIIYPAGTSAGLIFGAVAAGAQGSQTYTLQTYLNGVATGDSAPVGDINFVSGGNFNPQYSNFKTKFQFDAVELVYSQGGSTGSYRLDVYEFCTQ